MSKPKVLVTGASGFIGQHTLKPLSDAGFEVYGISRSVFEHGCCTMINGDILDNHFLENVMSRIKPQYLLHLAWYLGNNFFQSDENFSFLASGIRLIQLFHENGGKRAVYAGTCGEYEPASCALKEMHPLATKMTNYAFCKAKLHGIAEHFCRSNQISFAYGRIFSVYWKWSVNKLLLEKFIRNEAIERKYIPVLRDFMYVKDVAMALVRLLASDVEGAVNICTGESISVYDFFTTFAEKVGKLHLLKLIPDKKDVSPVFVGDNTRLVREVGYKPRYTLEQGMTEVAAEFLQICNRKGNDVNGSDTLP